MLYFVALFYKKTDLPDYTQIILFTRYLIPSAELHPILWELFKKVSWKSNRKGQIVFAALKDNQETYKRGDIKIKTYQFKAHCPLIPSPKFSINKNTHKLVNFLLNHEDEFDNVYEYSDISDDEDKWSSQTRELLQGISQLEHVDQPEFVSELEKEQIKQSEKLSFKKEKIKESQKAKTTAEKKELNYEKISQKTTTRKEILDPDFQFTQNFFKEHHVKRKEMCDEYVVTKYSEKTLEEKKNISLLLFICHLEFDKFEIKGDLAIPHHGKCGDLIINRSYRYYIGGRILYGISRIPLNLLDSFQQGNVKKEFVDLQN